MTIYGIFYLVKKSQNIQLYEYIKKEIEITVGECEKALPFKLYKETLSID